MPRAKHDGKKPDQSGSREGEAPCAREKPLDRVLLDLYADYLISSFSATTATGMSSALDGAVSHDEITRFLSERVYRSKDLWAVVKPTIREIETEEGCLCIDDTIEEKLSTDENAIIAWHYDHVFKRNVKGVNILTCLYHNELGTVPVGFEIVTKDVRVMDKKTGKVKRQSQTSKNEMARALIATCLKNQITFGYCLADTWFSSQQNMEFVVEQGKHFIFALKSNRTIALSQEEKSRGVFQAVEALEWEEHMVLTGYLRGMDRPVALTRQVFTHEDGSQGIRYLATSDLTLSYTDITTISHKRWKVEEDHTSTKSNLGLAKSPTKRVKTQSNHFFAVLYAYHKLERLARATHLTHFALKTKLYLKALQASLQELQALRIAAGRCLA